MKSQIVALMMISMLLSACGNALYSSENQPESGEPEVIKAIEDTGAPGVSEQDVDDSRNGSFRKNPEPVKATDTIFTVEADNKNSQRLYIWEEGNVPAQTNYTENSGNYFDDPSFRPFLTSVPVPEGTEVKGAVLLCAGGGFSLRANYTDTLPVAEELSKLGYQSFIVDYRLRPYTQEEGALDLGRAVRFVRENADRYGIDEKDIAVMGFSAGGIQAGELLLNYDGLTNGTVMDSAYVPDELDEISADASAAGMIYSFYGRLSVASKDIVKLSSSNLPPTYFVYGTGDPFVDEFEANIAALEQAGVAVRYQVLQDMPHGFGAKGGWIPQYDDWLREIFINN